MISRDLVLAGFVVEVDRLSDSESRALLDELADAICLRRVLRNGLSQAQKDLLIGATRGNPQAIKLALGLFNDASVEIPEQSPVQAQADSRYSSIKGIFDSLVEAALIRLEDKSLAIIHALLAFPGVSIPSRLLRIAAQGDQATSGETAGFPSLVKKYVQWGMMDHDVGEDAFILNRIVKECLARSPRISPAV